MSDSNTRYLTAQIINQPIEMLPTSETRWVEKPTGVYRVEQAHMVRFKGDKVARKHWVDTNYWFYSQVRKRATG